MGGDMIGSDLVELTTGYDFVKAVIDVSLGKKPEVYMNKKLQNAGIKFIFNKKDYELFNEAKKNSEIKIIDSSIDEHMDDEVTDSSNRHGYFIMISDNKEAIENILGR